MTMYRMYLVEPAMLSVALWRSFEGARAPLNGPNPFVAAQAGASAGELSPKCRLFN